MRYYAPQAIDITSDVGVARGAAEIEPTTAAIIGQSKGAKGVGTVKSARMLGPDIIVMDATFDIIPPGQPTQRLLLLAVLKRTNGTWLTEATMSMPAPAGK